MKEFNLYVSQPIKKYFFRKEVNHLHPDDIEGEEAGDSFVNAEEEIKFTPFNMKEELEEGHFDNEGHYHFKKNKDDQMDNWLDDIDWVKIKKDENYRKKYYTAEGEYSSDEEEAISSSKFDPFASFKSVLEYMKPLESVNGALQRLNKSRTKLTTAQKWKMKKQGIVDDSAEAITKLTGLVNEILTQTGNMNVYELTFEQIQFKMKEIEDKNNAGPSLKEAELDMYADDFDEKEKFKIDAGESSEKKSVTFKNDKEDTKNSDELMWEYKLTQDENAEVLGPFTTEQMQRKVDNGDFKDNVFCRKIGDERFYSSSRIDFDLYL